MPQTDLLFSRAEHDELVRFILEQGAWLVASHLKTAEVQRIRDLGAYRSHADAMEKLFHIQHRDYEQAPLEVSRVRSADGEEVFYVVQRTGGPTVDLLGPYEFEEDGIPRVAGGFISYYPTFWNPLTQSNEPAPVEQKVFYRTLVKHIKMMATRIKAGKRAYWVGRATLARLRGGQITLPPTWRLLLEI